jgi:hypothetical protein
LSRIRFRAIADLGWFEGQGQNRRANRPARAKPRQAICVQGARGNPPTAAPSITAIKIAIEQDTGIIETADHQIFLGFRTLRAEHLMNPSWSKAGTKGINEH